MLPDKLKEVLSEDDQKKLETAISELVEQKSNERAELKLEEKSVEFLAKLEADYAKKVEESITTHKAELDAKAATDLEALEESLIEKLSSFLDLQISEKISDDMLEKIAVNETYKPIVNAIKKIFEEKYVELDTDGHGLLEEAKEEIEALNDKVSSEITEKIALKETIDRLKADLVVRQKVSGLSPKQAEKVVSFFADKDLSETEKKIDAFVEMVEEKEEADDKAEKREALKENNDVSTGGDGLVESEAEMISKKPEEKNTQLSKANSLL